MTGFVWKRPSTTVVLAMSADGKIADIRRDRARFSSPADLAHLEKQIAQADGVLFGAGTLRAYGTTLSVTNPDLLRWRQQEGRSLQPVQIVCSQSANLDPQWRFFRQPIPRWLLTGEAGAKRWQGCSEFERVLEVEATTDGISWIAAFQQLWELGLEHLAVLGGGELVGALVAADLIDEFWFTVCPLILGGATAPTPVEGSGFLADFAPRLELLSVESIEQEVFLHYRRQR
ncbi:RibD family protein [Coleofasciculus sp. FACHB-129]|uniref:RibD family protein n=1 Tax=Cyanophyceae TaxID=3028117 RepID=UPI0016832C51|nr:RibD family protein [Coleofasciculus sp. FACHB-129]MBD1896225.1 RibD family protein [Coleofasciculus sp. FACHB-129]